MKPQRHITRLLKLMTAVRHEVSVVVEEHHVAKDSFIRLNDVEVAIHNFIQEIERTTFMKGSAYDEQNVKSKHEQNERTNHE